jgi:hypothetical protein
MGSASSAYSWFQSQGQIVSGASPQPIIDPNASDLSYGGFGGNMPGSKASVSSTFSSAAASDITAWANAGAQNN